MACNWDDDVLQVPPGGHTFGSKAMGPCMMIRLTADSLCMHCASIHVEGAQLSVGGEENSRPC